MNNIERWKLLSSLSKLRRELDRMDKQEIILRIKQIESDLLHTIEESTNASS